MDAVLWIVVLLAVIVSICFFGYLLTWFSLIFTRLQVIQVRGLAESEVPEALRSAASAIEQQLTALGFEYRGATASSSLIYDLREPCLGLIFYHPECHAFAEVSETPYPGSLRPFEVIFHTQLPGGRVLHTSDCFIHQIFELPPEVICQDGYTGDLEQQWRLHNSRLNYNPAVPDDWSPVLPDSTDLPFFVDWFEQSYARFLEFWLASGKVVRLAKGVYFLQPVYALRYSINMVKQQGQAATVLYPDEETELPEGRYFLERQLAFRLTSNGVSKAILLLVSLAGFYLAFGLMLSWALVPLLIVVLLLHEYGHYWAMRYFGYTDTRIFFVPFLGAAAAGKKDDPSLAQEIIVYLAGPVPGILLGLGLIWSPWAPAGGWLHQFAVLSLVLNILNLLPLVPLDGGRIVEKLVFTRHATAKFWFYGLSTLCFVAGVWYTLDPVFGFLIAVTGFLAWNEWCKRPLWKQVRDLLADTTLDQVDERKNRLMNLVFEKPMLPLHRLVMAQDVLPFATYKPATLRAVMIGMLVYIALLGGSFAGAAHAVYSVNGYDDEAYYSVGFWRDAVKTGKEHDGIGWHATLSAISAIRSGPNPEQAEEFIASAEAQVARWRTPDFRLALWRLLKPELTDTPLLEQDVDYVLENLLHDQRATDYDRIYTLMRLLDTPSSMGDDIRLSLVEQTLVLAETAAVEDAELMADLYFRKGNLHLNSGAGELAKQSFERGLLYEQGSEYLQFQDDNYLALIDWYFEQGEYGNALHICSKRLELLESDSADLQKRHEYDLDLIQSVRQQQGWFLLLTDNREASAVFQKLMLDRQSSRTGSDYDRKTIEYLLDKLYSHQRQGLETASLIQQLRRLPGDHISRFIEGCECAKRGAFDSYRNDRYLELMQELGFSR